MALSAVNFLMVAVASGVPQAHAQQVEHFSPAFVLDRQPAKNVPVTVEPIFSSPGSRALGEEAASEMGRFVNAYGAQAIYAASDGRGDWLNDTDCELMRMMLIADAGDGPVAGESQMCLRADLGGRAGVVWLRLAGSRVQSFYGEDMTFATAMPPVRVHELEGVVVMGNALVATACRPVVHGFDAEYCSRLGSVVARARAEVREHAARVGGGLTP